MFNVLGSIIAAVVGMFFGFLWFSNFLFGKSWRAEMKWSDEEMEANKNKGMTKEIILGLFAEFVTAMVFSYFLTTLGIVGVGPAMVVAFWAWLGFSATVQFGATLWAKHTMKLFLINTSHRLVEFLLIAIVLSLF